MTGFCSSRHGEHDDATFRQNGGWVSPKSRLEANGGETLDVDFQRLEALEAEVTSDKFCGSLACCSSDCPETGVPLKAASMHQ